MAAPRCFRGIRIRCAAAGALAILAGTGLLPSTDPSIAAENGAPAELVLHLRFDEGQGQAVNDASRHANHGHLGTSRDDAPEKSAPTRTSGGRHGAALEFDGGDSVTVPNSDSLDLRTGLSVLAWIKTTAPQGDIVTKSSGANNQRSWTLFVSDGRAQLSVSEDGTSSAWRGVRGRAKIADGQWHQVCATYDGACLRLYVDGEPDGGPHPYTTGLFPSDQPVRVGHAMMVANFRGAVDDVKIYGIPLGPSEVKREYEGKPVASHGTSIVPSLQARKTAAPPTIDGVLDEACWQGDAGAALLPGDASGPAKEATDARVAYDDRALYLAFRCRTASPDRIIANAKERDGAVLDDDCVEVFVSPGLDRRACCHFATNLLGTRYDRRMDGGSLPTDWDADWQAAAKVREGHWAAEMALPFCSFDIDPSVRGTWGLNLCRRNASNGELSAWSPAHSGVSALSRLGRLTGLDVRFGDYAYRVSPWTAAYRLRGGKVVLDLRTTVENATGRGAATAFVVRDLRANRSHRMELDLKKDERRDVAVAIEALGESYALECKIVDLAMNEPRRCCASLLRLPGLMRSCLDRSYYTGERTATVCASLDLEADVLKRLSLRAAVKRDGQVVQGKQAAVAGSGPGADLPLDVSALPVGRYAVDVSLCSGTAILAKDAHELSKLAPRDREVKVDRRRLCLLVNGEGFFPIGVYGAQPEMFDELAQAGFNTVYTRRRPHCLEAARNRSLRAFVGMPVSLGSLESADFPQRFEEQLPKLTEAVKELAGSPALLGYYSVDEPNVWFPQISPDGTGEQYCTRLCDAVRAGDPYCAVWATFAARITFGRGFDVAAIDAYWRPLKGQTPAAVVEPVRKAVAVAERERFPFWFIPQTGTWSGCDRNLTPEEQRCQTYLGIIHGAKGLFWWCYYYRPAPEPLWNEVKKVAGEISRLSPVLLSDTPVHEIASDADSPIHLLVKRHDGKPYLIAANATSDAVDVECTLNGLRDDSNVKVWFEDRTIPSSNGAFQDRFAGYATHVYEVESPTIPPMIQVRLRVVRRQPEPPAVAEAGAPDGNLLREGSFEVESARDIRLWDRSVWPAWDKEAWRIDADTAVDGKKSLRITPRYSLYSKETGFGWDAPGARIASLDLGGPDPVRRDFIGGEGAKGVFRVDVANGRHRVELLMRGSRAATIRVEGKPIPDEAKRKGNPIDEVVFGAEVADGRLELEIEGKADPWFVHSMVIKAADGSVEKRLDFGTPDSPVGEGWVAVCAPVDPVVWTKQRLRLKDDRTYTFSVYLKSDVDGLPVRLRMIPYHGHPWREQKTVNVSTEWKRYAVTSKVPLGLRPAGLIFVSVETAGVPGTLWVDKAELVEEKVQ